MSIRQTAVPTGAGIGALLLPAIAIHAGFAWVYAALAAMCVISAILAMIWLHEPEAATASGGGAGMPLQAPVGTSPLRSLPVWRVVLGIAALCMPQVAVLSFASIFLHDVGHAGTVAVSAALAAVQGGAAIMRVGSGHWTDRRGNRRGYLRGCALITVGLFALLATLTAWADYSPHGGRALVVPLAVLLVLGGVSASAWHGVAFTELATLAGNGRVGTALAMGNTGAFAAFWLAPSVIPLLLSTFAWPAVWGAAAACAALAWPAFPRADGPFIVGRSAGRKPVRPQATV